MARVLAGLLFGRGAVVAGPRPRNVRPEELAVLRGVQDELLLWHLGGMAGSRTVRFCLARASASGIPASTARRAVNDLAAHGLVSVVRRPGQGLDVTILDCPEV